jgi:polyribonucleotide 5'-hydroxyl-kinase
VASSSGCCTLRLVAGSAEIFGAELAIGKDIELLGGGAPTKLVVFTWHGCTIDVDDGGNANAIEMAYVSEETQSNVAFVNTHAQLEAMRDSALAASEDGPRVLVVGGPDSGKTSLVRTLAAYGTSGIKSSLSC